MFNFFFFANCAVNDIIWKNLVALDRPQLTECRMCNACWIPKDTKRLSEYVLIAFPLQ